jgi:segregation and condensation protein A
MSGKPFWLEEPWVILVDLSRTRYIDPWSIDLKTLISGFLEKLKSYGLINFSIPGLALLSSAIIFKLKVDHLFNPFVAKVVDEGVSERRVKPVSVPDIPTIDFPLRCGFASLDVETLLKLVVEVIEEASRVKARSIDELIGDSQPIISEESFESQIDSWIRGLEERIEILLRSGCGSISFYKLTEGMDVVSQVRVFIALLFLASQGKVELLQDEDESDLIVSMEGYKVWLRS